MERGLYIAATGMLSDVTRQDIIAANLANINTNAYKVDRPVNETFSELFLTNLRNGREIGSMNMGTRIAEVVTDFSQGPLRPTQGAYDMAITGDGFFKVMNASGSSYTRNGQFTKTDNGYLVTARGDYVLDTNDNPIYLGNSSSDPKVGADGRIVQDNVILGQIKIVTLDIPNAKKIGESLWEGKETGTQPTGTDIKQGFLEGSGVNSINEMVEMIRTLRSYESSQKAITSIDGTLDKAVNSVGVVS
jgi:flagellar basal-body rod protein FlgG